MRLGTTGKLSSVLLLVLLGSVLCNEGSSTEPSADDPSADDHSSIEAHKGGGVASHVVAPICGAFMVAVILINFFEKCGLSFIPESAVVIVVGMCLGFILLSSSSKHKIWEDEIFGELNATVLNLILLPLIIFESGWSLRTKDFASQFPYILIFAVIGSVISMLTVGSLICATSQYHGLENSRVAFIFAALIAATDPVATLSTYSSLKVEPLLNIMVFGESTINDAVAITLFNVLNDDSIMVGSDGNSPPTGELVLQMTLGVLKQFFGSAGLGLGLGIVYVLVLRFVHMRHSQALEILFIAMSCFLTFAIAEGVCHLSGIMAVLFCSIFMGIYARPHLSREGSMLTTFYIKQCATLADLGVFLLVGINVVNVDSKGLSFSLWVMLFCLVARAVSTFPLGLMANGIKTCHASIQQRRGEEKESHYLSGKHLFMMWHAGLRGAIALVLCLELGDWVDTVASPDTRAMLRNCTFFLIFVFLLVFGGTTEMMLRLLRIPLGKDMPHDYLYTTSILGCTDKVFTTMNERVFEPVLIGDERLDSMVDEAEKDLEVEAVLDHIMNSSGRSLKGYRHLMEPVPDEDETTESE